MAMTPAEEAAYALNYNLPRDGLRRDVQAEYDRLLQQRQSAAAQPGGQKPPPTNGGPGGHQMAAGQAQREDLFLTYARQTRNATVFIAWVVGIVLVLSLIGVIATSTELAHLNSVVNGGNSSCVPGVTC